MLLSTGSFFNNPNQGGGGGGGSDPYFANVVLLLGFEGSDGATSTTDESPSAHSFTFNGNSQLDTAQAAFGVSSCLFDGTGDYLSTPDHADWLLSSANSDTFTIEFWIRAHGNVSNQRVMGQAPAVGNWSWDINSSFSTGTGDVSFRYTSNGSTATVLTSASMSLDAWHYIAVSKNSAGKIRLWRDGTLDVSNTPANSAMFNSTGAFEIGRNFATANLNGWMDEIRITKGVCRYDTDGSITVPTAAFPRS